MRCRVIYFRCLCYLAPPLCMVSVHLTRCVSFFFLCFLVSCFFEAAVYANKNVYISLKMSSMASCWRPWQSMVKLCQCVGRERHWQCDSGRETESILHCVGSVSVSDVNSPQVGRPVQGRSHWRSASSSYRGRAITDGGGRKPPVDMVDGLQKHGGWLISYDHQRRRRRVVPPATINNGHTCLLAQLSRWRLALAA